MDCTLQSTSIPTESYSHCQDHAWKNHISHHPTHLDTLDCFLFLLCHICLQLVGHATVSLVTLFSTLDASLHAARAHFVGHKKTSWFFTYETIQATYAMWLWRRTAPDQGKQPIFLLSFTAFKKCSLPVFLSTPQYRSGLLALHHLPYPGYSINPLRPTIHIQILHIELHTFP